MIIMKNIRYIKLILLALIAGMSWTSCNDDDTHDTTEVEVKQIYLEDYKSVVPDRPVDFARLGQLIRIEGKGFTGVKKIYINGYDTYFNLAYVTNTSMLLNVSDKTPVIEAADNVRNTIRFVKSGTETTYPFIIRAASPSATSISNTLPMAGEKVIVSGAGLHETVKVTLPGGTEITSIESDEDGEWYSFIMPSGISEGGSIYSEGANGTAATAPYFNYINCMVLNFDGQGSQGYWGWSENGSMINADDLVDDPMNSGRGKCVQIVPDRLLEIGVAAGKTRVTECWTAGNDNDDDDWSRMYTFIPEMTSLNEVALQFDVCVPEAWGNCGYLQVVLYNSYNFLGIGSDDDGGRTAFYIPYIKEGTITPFKTDGWVTVTIPFSEFGYYKKQLEDSEAIAPTFQNVVEDRLAANYRNFGIGFVNNDFTYGGVSVTATMFTGPKIYLDNWRIVPCERVAVSDFNDEESN